MVNRVDLFGFGGCGEFRVVYTKDTGRTERNNRMTIIFEFDVLDDGNGCRDVADRWTALRGLSGTALADAAVALLEDSARPERLAQLRTNEFISNPTWELRQFHLVGGAFEAVGVSDSPPFALAQDRDFRRFVVDNAARFNAGAREQDLLPARFLGPSSLASGERLAIGPLVPSIPGLEANLNIMTCAGCHLTETGTGFVHVGERDAARPSELSPFLRSELIFRALLLEDIASP